VVVVVGSRNSHGVPRACKSGFLGHISKCAVVIVMEQAIVKRRIGFAEIGKARAVGYEKVRPAVVVIIKDRNSCDHGFHLMLLPRGAISYNHRESGGVETNFGRMNQWSVRWGSACQRSGNPGQFLLCTSLFENLYAFARAPLVKQKHRIIGLGLYISHTSGLFITFLRFRISTQRLKRPRN